MRVSCTTVMTIEIMPKTSRMNRFLQIAERKIDDTATEEKHEHRLAHDFQNNSEGGTPAATRKLVETLAFEPGLCLSLTETHQPDCH